MKHPSPGRHHRSDDGDAFMPDPGSGPARTADDFAEAVAEDFLEAATSGERALDGGDDSGLTVASPP